MAALVERLSPEGPLVDVYIEPDPVWAEVASDRGLAVPLPERSLALIDTGAAVSLIDLRIADEFGLTPTGLEQVRTVNGIKLRQKFRIGLSLTSPRLWKYPGPLVVIGADLAAFDFRVILGRDVLAHCRFGYDGPAGAFTLDY